MRKFSFFTIGLIVFSSGFLTALLVILVTGFNGFKVEFVGRQYTVTTCSDKREIVECDLTCPIETSMKDMISVVAVVKECDKPVEEVVETTEQPTDYTNTPFYQQSNGSGDN